MMVTDRTYKCVTQSSNRVYKVLVVIHVLTYNGTIYVIVS